MTPHAFETLGFVEAPHDDRDIQLGKVQAPTGYPAVYTSPAWSLPIEYQGKQPACGAHAGIFLKEVLTPAHHAPRFTWSQIKAIDGVPIAVGTDIRSVFKSMQKSGVLEAMYMANNVDLSLDTYAHPTITQVMKDNAANHKISTYAFVDDTSFEGLKRAIYQNKAVLMAIQVGSEFWTAANGTVSWQEADICPLRPPKTVVSGHFIVAHSYDEQYIYFANSFSDAWGRKGHGYFGQDYVKHIGQCATAVDLLFSKDLRFGTTDDDVRRLQVRLNENPATRIADSGPGSPGNETAYFGPLTIAAVRKYQALHNLPTTGFVGPLTRAALSA